MSNVETTTKKKRITRAEAKKRFLKFRSREMSMEKLAKAIGVSVNYVYVTLIPEISRETGIPREELLYKPNRSSVVNPKTPGKTSKKEAEESMKEADSDDFVGTLEGLSDETTAEGNAEATSDIVTEVATEEKAEEMVDTKTKTEAEDEVKTEVEIETEPEEQTEVCDNEMLMQIIAVLKETKGIINTMITKFQEVYQK